MKRSFNAAMRLGPESLALQRLATIVAALLAMCIADAAAQDAQAPRNYLTQIGPHFLYAGNPEEPFLNMLRPGAGWRVTLDDGSQLDYAQLVAEGHIDPASGLIRSAPPGANFATGPTVFRAAKALPDYYAGAYILDWEGDAYGYLEGQPRDLQRRIGENTLSFSIRRYNEGARTLRFSRIGEGGIRNVRLYRREHTALIDAGEIWNPDFVNYIAQYDIIRTMDWHPANWAQVRSFAEIATPDAAFLGVQFGFSSPPAPHYGAPYEYIFDLAVKSGVSVWMNAPIMLGAPVAVGDPSLRGDDRPGPKKVSAMAQENGAAIIESPLWEDYAKNFVDRLIASGYPRDRMLYLELGNEIWNNAYPFGLFTRYAEGVGKSVDANWTARHGYGYLSARLAAAIETELAARGADYSITYVLAGMTVIPATTRDAIAGFKTYLAAHDFDEKAFLSRVGIAAANYVGCAEYFAKDRFNGMTDDALKRAWESAVRDDGDGLAQELHDYCLDGPAKAPATRNWIIANWKRHAAYAHAAGVRFIGGYEGGGGDRLPKALSGSTLVEDWWRDYFWGDYGADVVRQTNLSLIRAFPGAILANYTAIGAPGEAPWIEGHYSKQTPALKVWDEFARPAAAE